MCYRTHTHTTVTTFPFIYAGLLASMTLKGPILVVFSLNKKQILNVLH